MTEANIVKAAREALASHSEAIPTALRLVEEGLLHFPKSAQLWVLRGDLIQLGSADLTYSLNDALSSYRAALEHEPGSAGAHEAIGRFLDAVYDSPTEAEPYLRKAVQLGGGRSAEKALAGVLEQLASGNPEKNAG
jgi:Tfp pilus assembly protein PilF